MRVADEKVAPELGCAEPLAGVGRALLHDGSGVKWREGCRVQRELNKVIVHVNEDNLR